MFDEEVRPVLCVFLSLLIAALFRVVLNRRRAERKAREAETAALSCKHGRKRWSSIPCEPCTMEFVLEARMELYADKPNPYLDAIRPDREVARMKREKLERDTFPGLYPRGEQAGLEYRGSPVVGPSRSSLTVTFEHVDLGLCLVETLNGPVQLYRDRLSATVRADHHGEKPRVLETYVDCDRREAEGWCGGGHVAEFRYRRLKEAMHGLATKLLQEMTGRVV